MSTPQATASNPMGQLSFRTMSEADLEAFAALYKICFNIDAAEMFIRWRYFEIRSGQATPTVLAYDGNKCVGSYGVWPTLLSLNGRTALGAQSMDTMTHPDYRGRGLFVRLAEDCFTLLAQRGYQFLYGFPNDNSYPGFVRRLNWDHVTDIDRWVRPLWLLGTTLLSGIAAAASLVWSPTLASGIRIESGAPSAEAVAALAQKYEDTKDLCRVSRNSEWFSSRYHPHSVRNYQWIAAYSDSELRGVSVWRLEPESRRAYLCELIGGDEFGSAVLSATLRSAYRQKARVLDAVTNESASIRLLKASGFIRRPGPRLIVRSLTTKTLPANVHRAEAWRIFGGDFDIY